MKLLLRGGGSASKRVDDAETKRAVISDYANNIAAF